MPHDIDDTALNLLLARAGLTLSADQTSELKQQYAVVAAMAENVRKPRGRMAELAHTYGFTAEDMQ